MSKIRMEDIHWIMDILQNIDAGLVVLDKEFKVHLWNNFMESHSGIGPQQALQASLFDLFPDLDADWLRGKTDPVFYLHTRAFTVWEQRPYMFRFKNPRPITGRSSVMYQNITILPIKNINQEVHHVCLIVYDVTDIAIAHNDLRKHGLSS